MDISDLTKTSPVVPSVTAGGSFKDQSSAPIGNSLPDSRQVNGRIEVPSAENPVYPTSVAELNNLVEQANVSLQGRSSDLKFTVAEGTDISVVRIEDTKTGELIRQIPSEAMVAIARALDEAQRGTVLKEKA